MPKLARVDPLSPASDARRTPMLARVWDPVVRLFHWSLVASFAVAWFSANRLENLHIWTGYAAGGLIALRLVWGIVGSRYARFSSFVRGPGRVLAYLRTILAGTEARHLGHNPAGGVMVLALMSGVAGLAVTGWMQYTDTFYGEDWVANLHGYIADGVLALIILHLGGVALASWRHRENLVRAMVTGQKRDADDHDIA